MITKFKIYELFDSGNIYNVSKTEDKTYSDGFKVFRYEFITKDDIKYRVMLEIENDVGKIDFDTIGLKNDDFSSIIQLINSHDSIKVFNTLKHIIYLHDMKKLMVASTRDRIKFYERLLKHWNMKIEVKKDEMIIATL